MIVVTMLILAAICATSSAAPVISEELVSSVQPKESMLSSSSFDESQVLLEIRDAVHEVNYLQRFVRRYLSDVESRISDLLDNPKPSVSAAQEAEHLDSQLGQLGQPIRTANS